MGLPDGDQAVLHSAWQARGKRLHREFQREVPRRVPERELVHGHARRSEKIERWRMDYNHHRPHSSLGNLTPAEFVAMRADATACPRPRSLNLEHPTRSFQPVDPAGAVENARENAHGVLCWFRSDVSSLRGSCRSGATVTTPNALTSPSRRGPPDELFYRRRPARHAPRFEPRARWP